MVGIIDYRAGNLTSVARALQHLSIPAIITDNPAKLADCERIIFPGVGAAGQAMADLKLTGMDNFLKEAKRKGVPILGICLGTQIIMDFSEENETPCLGLIPGVVKRFPEGMSDASGRLKVPHMGWNRVEFTRFHPVFEGITNEAEFYFVHSYFPVPQENSHAIGWTDYGLTFCSVVAAGNIVAVQFHPEKSGKPGLEILKNFSNWSGQDA
ncbi:MAG TPA: imidazole glycerol phosphate synthase subunit HisH [Syntrophales bacterium]|nr:imidazole glycerol phosphate synthase subunit HisH [Syntrophales bacterium]HOL59646.1 imidazole glycerol phosphate synthase subunit HisH [Syntrophales bacterium]HPO35792.1 imidazole glycerol phosphate synthase subunit HisH [Syntrophales bacterium]